MCGISGIIGESNKDSLLRMQAALRHRGPDADGVYFDPDGFCALAHNRLSIIDLSDAGRQPMTVGPLTVVFNGEIYNYLELRRELEKGHRFRTGTDTEVMLAAFEKWGPSMLDRLIGMFAFVIWDERDKTAFGARDRFGVKPFYYHRSADGTLYFASEIKALHAAGVPREPNLAAWADYLAHGLTDHSEETFWKGVYSLPAGRALAWNKGEARIARWYDLAERTGAEFDRRSEEEVCEEYLALLRESVSLRFRADVPVGINLSGGVDSSTLLGIVHSLEKDESSVAAYTFTTADERYDELPWVRQMLERTSHPLVVSELRPEEVPGLAAEVQDSQDEPYSGIPTLAYAKLFRTARDNGTIVLLDGNGLDEQWAGYDYYRKLNGAAPSVVQGTTDKPTRAGALRPDVRSLAREARFPEAFPDRLRNAQYRDVRYTKIPRAMRFNDRISMRSSTELREPFLDHRLFELAFRQSPERKIGDGKGKKMLREMVAGLLPAKVAEAPKRALQTPQREWLRGPLREWAGDHIENALAGFGGTLLDRKAVRREWHQFLDERSDNSFYIWQWISLSLMSSKKAAASDILQVVAF